MLGKNNPGFSLLQLMIVVAILGLVSAVAIPNLFRRKPSYEQKAFVTALNSFLAEAWTQGETSQKTQKIVFDFEGRKVHLELETDKYNDQGAKIFEPVTTQYAPAAPSWPEVCQIQQFFVQGADELSQRHAQTDKKVWFFMLPGGLSQEVIINMVVVRDPESDHEGKKVGLVLNPFTKQFKTYDEFQNP